MKIFGLEMVTGIFRDVIGVVMTLTKFILRIPGCDNLVINAKVFIELQHEHDCSVIGLTQNFI